MRPSGSIAKQIIVITVLISAVLIPAACNADFTGNSSADSDSIEFSNASDTLPLDNDANNSSLNSSIDSACIAPPVDENNLPGETEPVREIPIFGIYSGSGSWDLNVEALSLFMSEYDYKWKFLDHDDLSEKNIEEYYGLIWFPGGFAAEYKNLIPLESHETIIEFVSNGGMYVGSCAGAYYASSILRWFGEDHPYPLSFFPGKASGPLSGLLSWGEAAEIIPEASFDFNLAYPRKLNMFYFDGPYFIFPDDSAVEDSDSLHQERVVLARYSVNGEPAIIAGRFGKGKYLLLGPHPELGGYNQANDEFIPGSTVGAQWPWLSSALNWFVSW